MSRVLLVGGPGDGKWLDGLDHLPLIRYPEEPQGSMFDTLEELKVHEYFVRRLVLFRKELQVALHSEISPQGEDKAIIKALFQRDVAEELMTG